jgi:hypothetical protein
MGVVVVHVPVAGSYTSTTLVLGAPPIAYSFPLTAAAARIARAVGIGFKVVQVLDVGSYDSSVFSGAEGSPPPTA